MNGFHQVLRVVVKNGDRHAVIFTVGTLSDNFINEFNSTALACEPPGYGFSEFVALFMLGCAEDFNPTKHDSTSTLFLVATSVHGQ